MPAIVWRWQARCNSRRPARQTQESVPKQLETALRKAPPEMAALAQAVVKALTGTDSMDPPLIDRMMVHAVSVSTSIFT